MRIRKGFSIVFFIALIIDFIAMIPIVGSNVLSYFPDMTEYKEFLSLALNAAIALLIVTSIVYLIGGVFCRTGFPTFFLNVLAVIFGAVIFIKRFIGDDITQIFTVFYMFFLYGMFLVFFFMIFDLNKKPLYAVYYIFFMVAFLLQIASIVFKYVNIFENILTIIESVNYAVSFLFMLFLLIINIQHLGEAY